MTTPNEERLPYALEVEGQVRVIAITLAGGNFLYAVQRQMVYLDSRDNEKFFWKRIAEGYSLPEMIVRAEEILAKDELKSEVVWP